MKWTLVWMLVAGAFMLAASQQLDAEDENNELVARMAADDDETAEPNDTASNEDEDDDDEVNLRVVRSAPNAAEGANGGSTSGRVRNRGNKDKNNQQQSSSADRRRRGEGKACRYTKGAWSECDTATNQRTRSLTLKKGDSSCEQAKTITKKCKKGTGAGRRNRN